MSPDMPARISSRFIKLREQPESNLFLGLRHIIAQELINERNSNKPVGCDYRNYLDPEIALFLELSRKVHPRRGFLPYNGNITLLNPNYTHSYGAGFPVSNEPLLPQIINYLPHGNGVPRSIIAVGSDQGLTLASMVSGKDDKTTVTMVDHDPIVSLVTLVYLETLSRMARLLKRTPTPNEFITFFNPAYNRQLIELLSAPITDINFDRLENEIIATFGTSDRFIRYLSGHLYPTLYAHLG